MDSRAAAQHTAQRTIPVTKTSAADENSPEALATGFNAITDPRAQTAFWRSLTAVQLSALLNTK